MLEIDAIVDRIGDLEAILPDDKRLNCAVYHRGVPEIGKNDDPRWNCNQRRIFGPHDELDGITWSLADRPPTSPAGVAALLTYATEHSKAGYEWPLWRHEFVDGRYKGYFEQNWRADILAAAAQTLSKLAA